jgi:uncharacterized protein (TIGR00266 family)
MQYKVEGGSFPAVICRLEAGEAIDCQKGAMSWMSANINMATSTGGGIGKMFGRALSGESIFTNTYTATASGAEIAFASTYPGQIMTIDVSKSPIVAQKSAFLAKEQSVEMSIFFQKKLGAGFFGGEGFIMQKFSGSGMAFLEIGGSVVEYDLGPGEVMYFDTGYLAAMDATCSMDIEMNKGIGNALFGGEGLFNTKVTGPGHIWVQTMPIMKIAESVQPFIISK